MSSNISFSTLLPESYKSKIEEWLIEDCPSFDYGGFVVGSTTKTANLLQKSPGMIAGVPFFNHIFHLLNCHVTWIYPEATISTSNFPLIIATVTGPANKILSGERLALNILARCSGIATRANDLKSLAIKNKWTGIIAGTRKTTPGFRIIEKYGMLIGGADTHRYDLSSMIMLKDNHIVANGDIKNAVLKAKGVGGFSLKIEVECKSLEEARVAAINGADVVMLDNFNPKSVATAALALKREFGDKIIEVSGGLTIDNCQEYFIEGVDVLSFGCLSQGVPHIDFSLKIQP